MRTATGARRLIPVAVVVAAILAAYGGFLAVPGAEFVSGDDRFEGTTGTGPDLRHHLHSISETISDPEHWSILGRPVQALDYAVDFTLFGAAPAWFHLRSVLYHVLGSLLLLALLRRWGAGDAASTLGALVFALHPVQVESVAWITSRGDLLCLVFFLLALLLHARGGRWGTVGAAIALALALLSKEAAIVFPGAALLADFFLRDNRKVRTTLRRWPQYLLYGFLVGAFLSIWLHHYNGPGGEGLIASERLGGSFIGTVLMMCRGFVYYARLILIPVDMAHDLHITSVQGIDPLTVLSAAIQLGVLVAAVVSALRGGRVVPFAVLWFFVTLLPASNLAVPIGIPTAERFLLLPMAGLAVLFGTGLARIWQTSRVGRLTVALLLCCLAAVSAERAPVWGSEGRLWIATLDRSDAPHGFDRRIRTLREQAEAADDPGEARRLLAEVLAMQERQISFWAKLPAPTEQMVQLKANRLYVLIGLGRFDPALYEQVLLEADAIHQLQPTLPDARAVAAHALLWMDRLFEARQIMGEVLSVSQEPRILETAERFYRLLGESYLRDGNKALAVVYLRLSRDVRAGLDPDPQVLRVLADLDTEFSGKLYPLESARARNPRDLTILLGLAEVNARYGRLREALHLYGGLLRGKGAPRDPRVLFSLARWYWEPQDSPAACSTALDLYWELQKDSPEWEPARVAARRRACELR